MSILVAFNLSFHGRRADHHLLDFYDAAEALTGFQRTLALTAHLALNGEVISQAPYLRGARIDVKSPEEGSWKVVAYLTLFASGLHVLGTSSRDSVYGNIATSLYDYVVNETMGFHVDFDKTLGQQYEELKKTEHPSVPIIRQSDADALVEKVESSVKQMHRPIYASESASKGRIKSDFDGRSKDVATLDAETFDYIKTTTQGDMPVDVVGRVSSYNILSFKGRIFTGNDGRTIPFEIAEGCRSAFTVSAITHSLEANALDKMAGHGEVRITAFRFESLNGRLKRLLVINATTFVSEKS